MANFDPKRIHADEVQNFVPVTLYQGDEELGCIQMPWEDVDGKSEKEVIDAALRAFRKLKAAEESLDRERIRKMAKNSDMPDALCFVAAAMLAANVVNIYIERAQEDEKERRFLEAGNATVLSYQNGLKKARPTDESPLPMLR